MKRSEMSTVGEKEVRKYLETLSFDVSQIPEASHQTPDFLVNDETAQYGIEVKDQENQQFIDFLSRQIASDKVN